MSELLTKKCPKRALDPTSYYYRNRVEVLRKQRQRKVHKLAQRVVVERMEVPPANKQGRVYEVKLACGHTKRIWASVGGGECRQTNCETCYQQKAAA